MRAPGLKECPSGEQKVDAEVARMMTGRIKAEVLGLDY